MPGLLENIMLDVGAHEPWPNDVLLYQPYPIEQILLPDNANCLATQAFLHMCGLPFKVEHRSNAEFMSPSGKVPFIKCGAFLVSELEPIVQFVGNKGISLTENLDAEQKSDLRAYMSLIFSVLMNAELYICWCDKKTYNDVTKVRNGSVFPWPLNYFQTWSKKSAVIRKLKLHGWHQKTLGSVYQEVQNCCQALSERLEGKEFFFGSKPTEIDALIFGHIFSIFLMSKNIAFVFLIVKNYPNLTQHSNRVYQAYFENENFNFENGTINQKIFISKSLDCNYAIKNSFERVDSTNESKNNNNKPSSAPKDKILPRREPRSLRKRRFNDVTPKKQESSDSSTEQFNQLASVKSTDPSSICSEIEISTMDDNLKTNSDFQSSSELDNHIDSTKENKPLQNTSSIVTPNNDNDTSVRKLETELTFFNSNLQPQSQSTLSDFSEIHRSENYFNALTTATANSCNENKNDENSLHSFHSSLDHKITSNNNNNTSDSIIPESKYYSISIDSINPTEENNLQSCQHLDKKISSTSILDTIIPDSKYNLITVTESTDNDLKSCESLDRKTSLYSSTTGSVDSKYDLISFDSQSSQP